MNEEIDSEDFNFKDSYSGIVLGDLAKVIKGMKTEEELKALNKIVRLSNELSHDYGKIITKDKIQDLMLTIVNYTAALSKFIKY